MYSCDFNWAGPLAFTGPTVGLTIEIEVIF